MDIGSNYQKEIKVFSNFCTEDILEKFYEYREERQKLEREAEIAKYDLIDSGISEKWADMMIGSLVRIITDKEPEELLPMNFKVINLYDEYIMEDTDLKLKSVKGKYDIRENISKLRIEKYNYIS